MKKTEKIIVAVLTIAFGILLMVLKADIVSILMTVLGVALIVFGVMDLCNKLVPPAVVKMVSGAIVILCGWVIVGAVLYIVAAGLLVVGILMLYEKIKTHTQCATLWQTLCNYAMPVLFIVIAVLLLFNEGNTEDWVFIVCGILTVIEGGLVLVDAFTDD